MELPLFVFVLVSFCGAQDWPPVFCHGKPCPEYTVTSQNNTELRSYDPTEWITTKMEGTDIVAFGAARTRLRNVEGYVDSWPVLITVKNGTEYWLSWFVAPGTNPQISDPLVIRESRPAADVYVRSFDEALSINRAKEEKDLLCEGLPIPCCALQTYAGAGYESYFSLNHHLEIWIYKNPVNSTSYNCT